MKKKLLLFSVLFALLLTPHGSRGEILLEGFYWMLEPSGNARVGEGTIVGTRFDLENDFGYGDSQDVPGFTVILGGLSKLGFSYLDLSLEAQKQLELDVTFSDLEFRTDALVSSEINTKLYRGFYRLGNTRGSFLGNAEVGVLYADFAAGASASNVGRTSVQADGATIYAGINAELVVGNNISLGGSFRFSQFDVQGFDFNYTEYELGGKLYLNPIYIGGGYRLLGIDAQEDGSNLDIDIEFSGPVIWGGVRF